MSHFFSIIKVRGDKNVASIFQFHVSNFNLLTNLLSFNMVFHGQMILTPSLNLIHLEIGPTSIGKRHETTSNLSLRFLEGEHLIYLFDASLSL